ncbi:MAG: GIY-YIG nuclease family protein [Bacteroidales bacterium]|nr:GIY-YIG nuclease family protein [Bacteroidales bacterium]
MWKKEIYLSENEINELTPISDCPYTLYINTESFLPIKGVNQNDLLFKITTGRSIYEKHSVEIKSNQNGIFVPYFPKRNFSVIKRADLLNTPFGYIFENIESALDYLFGENKSLFLTDAFTGENSIKWIWDGPWGNSFFSDEHDNRFFQIGGYLFIKFDFLNGDACLTISTDENSYLNSESTTRHYGTNKIKLQKKDTVSFLFDDGSILDYTAKSAVFEKKSFSSTLYKEDIDIFLTKKIISYRITFAKDGIEPITAKVVNSLFGDYTDDALRYYLNNYINIIDSLVKDYCFPIKKQLEPAKQYVNTECYVYLMLDKNTGYHKIGISNKPVFREKTLQSEKPTITMLACKKYPHRKIAEAIESALHTTYSSQRIRGEWFNLKEEDISNIINTLK